MPDAMDLGYDASPCPTFSHEDEQQEGAERDPAEGDVAREGCKSSVGLGLETTARGEICIVQGSANSRESLLLIYTGMTISYDCVEYP